jgi:enoyl-CoA hydratase/carnithine racemase
VVVRKRLLAEAKKVADGLARLDSPALAAAKEAVVDGMDMPLAAALSLERRLALRLAGGPQ